MPSLSSMYFGLETNPHLTPTPFPAARASQSQSSLHHLLSPEVIILLWSPILCLGFFWQSGLVQDWLVIVVIAHRVWPGSISKSTIHIRVLPFLILLHPICHFSAPSALCPHTHTPFSLSKPPLSSASALDLTRLDFGLDSTRYSTRTIPPPFCPSFDPTRSQVALSCSFYLLPHPRRTIHKTERRSDPGNCVSDFLSVSLPILWRHSSSMLLCSALPRFCVAQRRDVDIQCAKFLWSLGAPRTSLLRHGARHPDSKG